MTIKSKEIIIVLLENNGYYPGDPQMSSVWSYKNSMNNRNMFAVFVDESQVLLFLFLNRSR